MLKWQNLQRNTVTEQVTGNMGLTQTIKQILFLLQVTAVLWRRL